LPLFQINESRTASVSVAVWRHCGLSAAVAEACLMTERKEGCLALDARRIWSSSASRLTENPTSKKEKGALK
jgi:hypothetical protein